jgi:hypothetical protein
MPDCMRIKPFNEAVQSIFLSSNLFFSAASFQLEPFRAKTAPRFSYVKKEAAT